jgi:hypothetical protein
MFITGGAMPAPSTRPRWLFRLYAEPTQLDIRPAPQAERAG